MEREAGGAPGLPQLREGTRVSISVTSVWPRICRNSDRERKPAGPGVRA